MGGKGVEDLVRRALQGQLYRKDGPVYYAARGPWRVESEAGAGGLHHTQRLIHYGTKMLEWRLDTRHAIAGHTMPATVTGWWIGHGSVSDQTGVNAALRALGSSMRYSRDTRGGGPRVNPYRIASGMARLTNITPPVY